MIELIRYSLATIVAETHLGPLGIAWPGWQAVFAFYTLSGYLMTRVLNERYGFSPGGTAAFLVNRVLRLWPAYLSVAAATLLAEHFLPLHTFFYSLTIPHSLLESVTNLTVLGQVGFDFTYSIPLSRLSPTSWSLSIELCAYCLLAFYFGRSPARLFALAAIGAVALAASTAYCVAIPSPYYGPYCFQNRYGALQAGFIPFAVGGLSYFFAEPLRHWLNRFGWWMAAVLLGCEILVALNDFASVSLGPFLGTIAIVGVLPWGRDDRRSSWVVDFIGRASYHLFIAHMSIAAILALAFGIPNSNWRIFILSLAIAFVLSGGLVPLEWRLNRLRDRVSSSTKSSRTGPRLAQSGDEQLAEVR